MTRAIQSAGEIASLERSLNENLAALDGAKNLEETLINLSAAVHLLNLRIDGLEDSGTPQHKAERFRSKDERAA